MPFLKSTWKSIGNPKPGGETGIERPMADDIIMALFLAASMCALLFIGYCSLRWRMALDTPLFYYISFLAHECGYILYRDIFETSMPGSFAFYLTLTKFLGYGDFAFRIFDVCWLSLLLTTTCLIMRPFGRRVSLTAAILNGLAYFQWGPAMSLERDFVGILPIALGIFIAAPRGFIAAPQKRSRISLDAGKIGFLFGVSATIKPQLAIGLPAVLIFFFANRRTDGGGSGAQPWGQTIKTCFFAAMGLVLPLAGTVVWIWEMGSFPYLRDMMTSYLPLHLNVSGEMIVDHHLVLYGTGRMIYMIRKYLEFGDRRIWVPLAFMGVLAARIAAKPCSEANRLLYLLISMCILYTIYPGLSGQFYPYHWMPCQYFIILAASLSVIRMPYDKRTLQLRLIPVLTLVTGVLLCVESPVDVSGEVRWKQEIMPWVSREGERVDQIAAFLREQHLQPSDTVQPLDWTGGAIHAMLLAKAKLATRFLYDYHFYHDISNPYIKRLKLQFLEQLARAKPRFVIEVKTWKPALKGYDTTEDFIELKQMLTKDYNVARVGDGYLIHERKSRA